MADIVVGIHGLANKPEKSQLAGWWKDALDEGLEKNLGVTNAQYTFKMVYWADLLYKYPVHFDEALSFDDLYNDEPYIPAKEGALQTYEDGWVDLVRAKTQNIAGTIIDFAKEKFEIDALAKWVLEKTMKDLAYYYDKSQRIRDRDGKLREARQVLMGELERDLRPFAGDQVMVIAHSMGTIIAYDVLRDLGRTDQPVQVRDFITIGSPLGLPHVKGNIYREREHYSRKAPVRTPTIVTEHWVNFADRQDRVAFDTHLADDYAANDTDVSVKDDLVINDYVGATGEPNHHKSYGYLRTPELSRCLARFLGLG
jgi:hypothetical protein